MIEPNEPINPTIWDDRHNPNFVRDNDGLSVRTYTAIQLGAGMWSNPAILQHCRGDVNLMSVLIPSEAVKGADRLIEALNEPQATDYDNYFGEEENEDDKPSDYPEEK